MLNQRRNFFAKALQALSTERINTCAARSFSSVVDGDAESQKLTPKDYVKSRKEYEEKLTIIRKAWNAEFTERQRLKQEIEDHNKEQSVLRKAVKMREQKEKLKENKLHGNEKMRLMRERWQTKLAQKQKKEKAKRQIYENRLSMVKQWYEEEAKEYITESNMNEKITPQLFMKPSSTGLTNRYSDYWKYQILAPSLKRMINDPDFFQHHAGYKLKDTTPKYPDFTDEKLREQEQYKLENIDGEGDFGEVTTKRIPVSISGRKGITIDDEDKEHLWEQYIRNDQIAMMSETKKKVFVEDFLNKMISTGDDRGKFDDYVKKIMEGGVDLEYHERPDAAFDGRDYEIDIDYDKVIDENKRMKLVSTPKDLIDDEEEEDFYSSDEEEDEEDFREEQFRSAKHGVGKELPAFEELDIEETDDPNWGINRHKKYKL